ncbi:nuclear transport factor 2 family protein [Nocardia sp. NPDC052566]|uniref:nuclear transport factor 2 family protein n=1 Tax=Nocardia sp. NPDC052566 TaxID=3364330 RepID=UPI0037C88441
MTDQYLHDRAEISDICRRVGWYLDTCAWDDMTELFTDEVLLDYRSLTGQPAETISRDQIIQAWRRNREGLTATQHMISNQLVEVHGDTASATAMYQATQYLPNPHGGPLWRLGGEYHYRLVRESGRWRISALTMIMRWADGNRHIRDLARESAG